MTDNRGDCIGVTGQCVDIGLGSHVPHSSRRITAASHQNIDRRMQCHTVNGAQMAVVMANDLITNQSDHSIEINRTEF